MGMNVGWIGCEILYCRLVGRDELGVLGARIFRASSDR